MSNVCLYNCAQVVRSVILVIQTDRGRPGMVSSFTT